MGGHDDLIRRLTERLSVDRELQLDVAAELESHLEESAEEFRQAGQDEAEAADNAAKALGDPAELAEHLWAANKSRMRIRGVLRWSARLALVPAAIVTIILLASGLRNMMIVDEIPSHWLKGLAEEQQWVVQGGDPNISISYFDTNRRAKSLTDRWPDNPIYYGQYVAMRLAADRFSDKGKPVADKQDEYFALMDRGEQVDPHNALYNLCKAAWLVQTAATLGDDEMRTYEVRNLLGDKVDQKYCYQIEIHDANRFAQGLAEFQKALAKPFCTGQTIEFLDQRMSLLSAPRDLRDVMQRTGIEISSLMPPLSKYRMLAKFICAYGLQKATEGDANGLQWIRDVDAMALKSAADDRSLIELLVAIAVRSLALTHGQVAATELGLIPQAAEYAEKQKQQEDLTAHVWKIRYENPDDMKHVGFFWSVLTSGIPGYRVDVAPMRRVEQFVVMRVALLCLLAIIVLICLLLGAMNMLNAFVTPRNQRGIILWIGWRRIGRICLWALVVPITIYGAYAYWQTLGDDAYGLNYSWGRVLVEAVFALACVTVLLLTMARRATRIRYQELGMESPCGHFRKTRYVLLGIGGILTILTMAYVIWWWAADHTKIIQLPFQLLKIVTIMIFGESTSSLKQSNLIGLYLSAAIVFWLLVWGLVEAALLYRKGGRLYRRTLRRSLVPILASAVIVVGVICGGMVIAAERTSARLVTGEAFIKISNEIDRSPWRLVRNRFRELHTEAMRK